MVGGAGGGAVCGEYSWNLQGALQTRPQGKAPPPASRRRACVGAGALAPEVLRGRVRGAVAVGVVDGPGVAVLGAMLSPEAERVLRYLVEVEELAEEVLADKRQVGDASVPLGPGGGQRAGDCSATAGRHDGQTLGHSAALACRPSPSLLAVPSSLGLCPCVAWASVGVPWAPWWETTLWTSQGAPISEGSVQGALWTCTGGLCLVLILVQEFTGARKGSRF